MNHDIHSQTLAQAASSVASDMAPRVTTGGASAAALGWVLSNEMLGVIGVLIALAGWLTTFYYRRRDDLRAEELHQAQMRRLEAGMPEDAEIPLSRRR